MSSWDQAPVVKGGAWNAAPSVSPSKAKAATYAEKQLENTPGFVRAIGQGGSFGFEDEIEGGKAALRTSVGNLARRVVGQDIPFTAQEAYMAVRDSERSRQHSFEEDHPVQNFFGQFLGGLAVPAGVLGEVRNVGQAARAGAVAGGVYGFGSNDGDLGERSLSAGIGAGIGAVGGAALQGFGTAIGAGIRNLRPNSVANPVSRVINRLGGGRFVPPDESAAQQLLRGQDPQAMLAERARLQGLGVDPSVLDTLSPSGQRTMRSAASVPGPAADLAVQASQTARVDTKPSIMQATRGLSREQRTATQLAEDTATRQDNLADVEYRPGYEAQLPYDERIADALQGPQGVASIRRALRGADARRDQGLIQELEGLLSGNDAPATISGQALDRIRIALRQRAENASRLNAADVASGLQGRMRDIDRVLDDAPGLTDARGTYRDLQGQIDVLNDAPDIFTTDPVDFQRFLNGENGTGGLTPGQREALVVRTRQDILDTLGGQRAATTGSADALATSQYARQNLEALLGPQDAQRYADMIQARLGQNAARQFVSPNTGSQTFSRAEDANTSGIANALGAIGDVAGAARGSPTAIGRLIDRAVTASTMTPAEREQIAQLGFGSADELERIINLAQRSRNAGRAPPRQVRDYVSRATGVLGASHPVSQQLLRLVGPAGAMAQEDDPNAPAVTVETIGDMSVADYLAAQKAQQQAPPR